MELVSPAGSWPAFKKAVDNGADAIYIGFRDETNARHFAGLNFDDKNASKALNYARSKGKRVYLAINTYPQTARWSAWQRAVDMAADLGVNAIIAADIGVLEYASQRHSTLHRHLSVQGSATNLGALTFYAENFGIARAVLPRVLSAKQVAQLASASPVPLEVFGFGSLCIMAEGRCFLSSYVAGASPNTCGACSPASHVSWKNTGDQLEVWLGDMLVDRFEADENAGYPVICKGRFIANDKTYHAIEEPVSLNSMALLPELIDMGVVAIKLEGRQRSPAYIAKVVSIWRQAIDAAKSNQPFVVQPSWTASLATVAEGGQTTLGAYEREWQ